MCGAPGRPIVPSRGLRVYYARMLIPIAATAGAAALGAWAYGTYEPNSPLFGRAVGRGPTRERVAYLTFDDGPNPGATEPILETLAASDVPAAFFLVGEHVRRFPEVARRVAAAGHEVGNHTLRHQKLHFRGPRRIREELERTHELIVDTTGRVPRSFRAPHGYRNPFVGVATRRLGYTVFGWTFGVWDSDPRVPPESPRTTRGGPSPRRRASIRTPCSRDVGWRRPRTGCGSREAHGNCAGPGSSRGRSARARARAPRGSGAAPADAISGGAVCGFRPHVPPRRPGGRSPETGGRARPPRRTPRARPTSPGCRELAPWRRGSGRRRR